MQVISYGDAAKVGVDVLYLVQMPLGMPNVEPEPFQAGEGAEAGHFEVQAGGREIEKAYPLPYFIPYQFCFVNQFFLIVVAVGGDDEIRGFKFCVEIEEDAGDGG